MPSLADNLTTTAELLDQAHTGMELIEQISNNKDAKEAANILLIVSAIAKAIRKGLAGQSTPIDVQKELSILVSGKELNHAATQSEIDKKFPTG